MDKTGRRGKMKTTGIVRQMDSLGRIVLPIELRRTLDIAQKDSLEIYVEEDRIVLKKYEPTCIFCENTRDIIDYKGKNICPSCLKELKNF
jgi:transcriptional pleiotropic regulator of transition state genes